MEGRQGGAGSDVQVYLSPCDSVTSRAVLNPQHTAVGAKQTRRRGERAKRGQ